MKERDTLQSRMDKIEKKERKALAGELGMFCALPHVKRDISLLSEYDELVTKHLLNPSSSEKKVWCFVPGINSRTHPFANLLNSENVGREQQRKNINYKRNFAAAF